MSVGVLCVPMSENVYSVSEVNIRDSGSENHWRDRHPGRSNSSLSISASVMASSKRYLDVQNKLGPVRGERGGCR